MEIPIEISRLVRPNILALKPYSSARDEAPNLVDKDLEMSWLDANENSIGSPIEHSGYNRYPKTIPLELRAEIARIKAVDPTQVYIGNGSDEAIDLLFRAFCEPGKDNVIILPPTYGMYAVQGNIHGTEMRSVPLLPDFQIDIPAVMARADAQTKILFICSPNNPTGNLIDPVAILDLLTRFQGLVVVDEAYIDFAETPSWSTQIEVHPRLVILQTLSKAWGLAGLRIGIAIAHPSVIGVLNKIKYPYNINSAVAALATEALKSSKNVQENIATIRSERDKLAKELSQLTNMVEEVYPSAANFLLIRVKEADATYQYLAQHGVIVRNRSKEINCSGCLRITIGTPNENIQLINLLKNFK